VRAFLSIAITGFGVQLLTVISGPVVARMLGPDGRGEVALVTIVALIVSLVSVGGLPAAISHAVAAAEAPARDVAAALIPRWLITLVPTSLLAGVVTAIITRTDNDQVMLSVSATLVSYLLSTGFLSAALLVGEGNIGKVNIQRTVGMAAYVVIIVLYWAIAWTTHSAAHPWVVLMTYAVSLLFGTLMCWMWLRPPTGDVAVQADRVAVSSFARRGFFSGLNTMDTFGFDQLLVGMVLGQAALGLYAVGVSMTSVSSIVLVGFASILLPRMAAVSDAEAVHMLRRWMLGAVGLVLVMIVGIELVLGPALRIFFGHDFVPALPVSRILCLSWAVLALRRVLTAAAQAQGRVGAASIIEVVSTFFLAAAVLVGMHLDGLTGAGWGVLVAAVFSCAAIAWVVRWVPHPIDESGVSAESERP
jgi:O-antigen/teichoic acid export membrane protein